MLWTLLMTSESHEVAEEKVSSESVARCTVREAAVVLDGFSGYFLKKCKYIPPVLPAKDPLHINGD